MPGSSVGGCPVCWLGQPPFALPVKDNAVSFDKLRQVARMIVQSCSSLPLSLSFSLFRYFPRRCPARACHFYEWGRVVCARMCAGIDLPAGLSACRCCIVTGAVCSADFPQDVQQDIFILPCPVSLSVSAVLCRESAVFMPIKGIGLLLCLLSFAFAPAFPLL